MFNNVLSKGRIGSLEIKNRFVVPPMGTGRANTDGFVNSNIIEYYTERARGGFGLIIVEIVGIDPLAKAIPEQIMLDDDRYIPKLSELTASIKQGGARVFAQIHHAGRQTLEAVIGSKAVAPSPIPCPMTRTMPRELTNGEVYNLIERFGDAALRAKTAGFDGVEVHGAHGYLVAQFMSGYSNKRTDEFGGNLNRRMKFAIDIVKNIKKKCGVDFPICFRMSADERVNGGLKLPESRTIAAMLEEAGVDAIHVSIGVYGSMQWIIAPSSIPAGYLADDCRAIKQSVNIPVIAVGRIVEPYMAERIIADGAADFVSIGRGSLADPYLPNKTLEGRINEILSCVGCMTRCQGVVVGNTGDRGVCCMVNPFCGQEDKRKITPAADKKQVIVVGGGPAGLEAAWILAARGHSVTLYEKTSKLGGQFIPASVPPGKEALLAAIAYYTEMCIKYGVNIKLNTQVDERIILDSSPDVVILATGANPTDCGITGSDVPVVQAQDVLNILVPLGNNILIVGGGQVGLETAEYLISQHRKVTIVEMQDDVGQDMQASVKHFALKTLRKNNAEIITKTKVTEITKQGAVCQDVSGLVDLKDYDMVIMAVGAKAYNPLEDKLKDKVKQLYVIGDAKEARKAVEAIEEAVRVALSI